MHTQEQNFGGLFLALDNFFLTLFALEILVKWYHDFLGFWRVGWNIFDFVIVAASLLGPSKLIICTSKRLFKLCLNDILTFEFKQNSYVL